MTLDLAMDLLLSRPENTGENQPITNLKPWISANTTGTSENIKICIIFLLKYIWFTRNDLANKLRILLSAAGFANHAQFVFSWPAWPIYGPALATKVSRQNHITMTVARRVTRGGKAPYFLSKFELEILDCWAKIVMTACSWLFIPPSCSLLVFCRSFCVRGDCWVAWFVAARPAST